MKKRIVFIIVFFSCWAFSEAQQRFHLGYDYNIKNDEGRDVTLTNDGGYFVCGSKSSGGNPMGFLKVDSFGIQEFHKIYQVSFDRLNGGGLWQEGYYGFGAHFDSTEGARDSHFIFLNQNGDSIKTILYDFSYNDRVIDAVLTDDSNFVVLGFSDTAVVGVRPFIAEVDTLGNILWQQEHDSSTIQETVRNIQATPDGGYIIGGVEEETPLGHLDLFLLKVDSLGNQEWKQNYNEPLSQRTGHVEVLSDGSYALFGTGYHPQAAQRAILKIDTGGTLLWRRKHGTISLDEGYIVGKELADGGFICAGTSIRMYNGQPIDDINLSRLDSMGNVLWSRDFNLHGMDINQYVRDLKVTADSGYVMTGFILNAPGNRNDIFILKTDENGIITGIENNFQEVDIAKRVYPV